MERERRLEAAEQLLAERGCDLGRMRVAAGRSGVAIGFPADPMLHVAWWALAALAALTALATKGRASRRRR